MTTIISGSSPSITFSDSTTQSTTAPSTSTFGFKNRIINGGMVIDQRNAGASLTINTLYQYSVDRFNGSVFSGGTGVFTLQQSTTTPTGFINSLKATVTTADASPSANYGYMIQQIIEGLNCSDLNWGSANAQAVTVSFWAYSSVTGNLPIILSNSAQDRYYASTYSITANTWTKITIPIVGDTSGTWLTNNSVGIRVNFGLGGGSGRTVSTLNAWATSSYGGNLTNVTGATSIIATSGATFYITGVQLEVGTQATSFDFRDYGRELILCQRYYERTNSNDIMIWTGDVTNTNNYYLSGLFSVQKRTTPTFTATIGSANGFNTTVTDSGVNTNCWNFSAGTNQTAARRYFTGGFTASAEL